MVYAGTPLRTQAMSVITEPTCESRLEIIKIELVKARQAVPITEMLESPGVAWNALSEENLIEKPDMPHWPASEGTYVPPLVQYVSELTIWLRSLGKQWAVAAGAGAIG